MATLEHNILGDLTAALLSPGDKVSNVNSILIANTHLTDGVSIDLYIGTISESGESAVSYYLMRGKLVAKGDYLILDNAHISFNNAAGRFGLFITLNNSDSEVSVLIDRK